MREDRLTSHLIYTPAPIHHPRAAPKPASLLFPKGRRDHNERVFIKMNISF